VAKDSSQHVFALRDGRYNLLWVALFAIGLSGGLYFSNRIKSQLPASAPVAPLVQSNPPIGGGQTGAYAVSPASLPDERSRAPAAPPEIQSPGAQSAHGNAPAPSAGSAEVHSKPRLEGKGSLVILGVDAPAIHDLSQHPGRLPELVQSGSLFTAPRGAAVQVEETANGVLKVLLLEGAMAGREGWVPAAQVTR
jgi:hypothetical protein